MFKVLGPIDLSQNLKNQFKDMKKSALLEAKVRLWLKNQNSVPHRVH